MANHYKANIYEKAAFTAGALSLSLLIILPLITPHFVNVDNYINGSKTIEINKVIFVDWERMGIGGSQSKYVYTIKADSIYYALEYYKDGPRDHSTIELSKGKEYERLFIKLNPIELDKHRGSIEDPIPVYNYGFTANDFVWDTQKYEYNIKTHRGLEEILHIKSYEWILWLIVITCFVPLVIRNIKYQSEANAQARAAKKAKSKEQKKHGNHPKK